MDVIERTLNYFVRKADAFGESHSHANKKGAMNRLSLFFQSLGLVWTFMCFSMHVAANVRNGKGPGYKNSKKVA